MQERLLRSPATNTLKIGCHFQGFESFPAETTKLGVYMSGYWLMFTSGRFGF